MKVQAIKCNKCEDILFSRAKNDYRGCSCGTIAVNGGHFNGINWVIGKLVNGNKKTFTLEWLHLDVDEPTLFDDYSLNKHRFGLIKGNPIMKKKTVKKTTKKAVNKVVTNKK